MSNYNDLQKQIDSLIGLVGLNHSIQILKNYTGAQQRIRNWKNPDEFRSIAGFLQLSVLRELEMPGWFHQKDRSQKALIARQTVFLIMRTEFNLTYPRIAELFGSSESVVGYWCRKASEVFDFPQLNREFIHIYERVLADLHEYLCLKPTNI